MHAHLSRREIKISRQKLTIIHRSSPSVKYAYIDHNKNMIDRLLISKPFPSLLPKNVQR